MKYMIIIAFTCSVLTGVNRLYAQNAQPGARSFAGIYAGYSAISGNITHSDYNDPRSGYAAASGFHFGVDGAWYFHRHIGIGGVCSSSGYSASGLQSLSDGYKEDFDVDSTTVYATGRYSTVNVLVGPYFSFPMHRFTFDLRVLGGWVLAKTPRFEVDLEDQKEATFYQNSSSASAFGVQVGAGVRYAIATHLSLKLNADYFYSQPDFKITNENRVVNAGRLITEYHQPIAGVNINFGIAYVF